MTKPDNAIIFACPEQDRLLKYYKPISVSLQIGKSMVTIV